MILNICTKHGSMTAMLSAKFQEDWSNQTEIMDELHFSLQRIRLHRDGPRGFTAVLFL